MRPRERVRAKPVERNPLAEPADPRSLERFYIANPEAWTDEVLEAAVEAQRREREGRLAAKARKRPREVKKEQTGEDAVVGE